MELLPAVAPLPARSPGSRCEGRSTDNVPMPATQKPCPKCGQTNRPTSWTCTGCGLDLHGAAATDPDPATGSITPPTEDERETFDRSKLHSDYRKRYRTIKGRTGHSRAEEYFSLKNSIIAMALGAGLCTWDLIGGAGSFVLHFLSALTHEIGHAAVATFLGAPSFPVLGLDGQACTLHRGQFTWLAVCIWLFLGYMAYTMRKENKPWRVWVHLAIGYPIVAFTGMFDTLFLLAGHGGELAFAGIFLWRAWTGGFTHSLEERYTYASVGCFLAIHNLVFHFRLMTSAAYQSLYLTNGSYNFENDYIRVARDHLGVSLPTVATFMFVVNAVVLPLLLWILIRRRGD